MTVRPAVDDMVLGVQNTSKEKGRLRFSRLLKQNRTVDSLTAQYNAGPSRNVSEDTVQQILLDIELRSRRRTNVPLLPSINANYAHSKPGNITTRSSVIESELPYQMNYSLSDITSMAAWRHAVFQVNGCSLNVQHVITRPLVAVLCFEWRSFGRPYYPTVWSSSHWTVSNRSIRIPFPTSCILTWRLSS